MKDWEKYSNDRLPQVSGDDFLFDDKLEDKQTNFDSELIDSRSLDGWLINKSESVIKLDIPMIEPDVESEYLILHASYQEAIAGEKNILPSVNLIDGKAKQFDDGLYAALTQAYYQGLENSLQSQISLIKQIYDQVDKGSSAANYLAAGLELANVKVAVTNHAAKQAYLDKFNTDETISKPVGFYTWSGTLKACYRFRRFFQQRLGSMDELLKTIAGVLRSDVALQRDYQKMVDFYAKLTNPPACGSILDLMKANQPEQVYLQDVAIFPPSTTRETVLFTRLFPDGIPVKINLMMELINRIKSGEVNLRPDENSGWYEYQVYALETLLLPEKGEEHNKLLLTKSCKKRMLEAFKALITKRRETHMGEAVLALEMPPKELEVSPQLRIEPGPSYYLRTARSYAFLQNFLAVSIGENTLKKISGLKKDGQRKMNLWQELEFMKKLFYGFYLISCEDIGIKPTFLRDETVETDCVQLADQWLSNFRKDVDLSTDTRVCVPIANDGDTTRFWATLGVRLTRLDASYARPPSIKPQNENKNSPGWQVVEDKQLRESCYLIVVDESAEFVLPGSRALTREEFRKICDQYTTKEEILKALSRL